MKLHLPLFLVLLWACVLSPREESIVKKYYMITSGDTLVIRDSLVTGSYSKYEILNQVRSIDSVIAKIDSSVFFVDGVKFDLRVKGSFEVAADSAVSLKGYYVAIDDGDTEKDYFGVYVKQVGTISLKSYEQSLVIRLFKIEQRDINRLQDLCDSVIMKHTW
jgi:hypothetical protein